MTCGVLLIDKPAGKTSHDVVALLRRRLGTRRVGHAGTLDPMATGLLVGLVGEATKLEPYLSSSHKRYVAEVSLGAATDTLDREGEITHTGELPAALVHELAHAPGDAELGSGLLRAALDAEGARRLQIPPAYSAIKIDGVRSHRLARSGREVELAPRDVRVLSLELLASSAEPPMLRVQLDVSKGYYVRAFARDLGEGLGVPAHLSALRRTRSGPFQIEDAVAAELLNVELTPRLIPLLSAARAALAGYRADAGEAAAIKHGVRVPFDASHAVGAPADPEGSLVAVVAPEAEQLLAIARVESHMLVVQRGFAG